MRELTVEVLRGRLTYSPETGIFVRRVGVHGYKAGTVCGHLRAQDGYTEIWVLGYHYKAHRLAWFYMTGEWPPGEIDHINGDRNDNRFCNLRSVTRHENALNGSVHKDNGTGLRGVTWDRARGLYMAQIMRNGRRINLGRFDSKDRARQAYLTAAETLHGEFMSLR